METYRPQNLKIYSKNSVEPDFSLGNEQFLRVESQIGKNVIYFENANQTKKSFMFLVIRILGALFLGSSL